MLSARRGVVALVAAMMALGGCRAGRSEAKSWTPLGADSAPTPGPTAAGWSTIGASRQGRPILARVVGGGPVRMLLIGSIHGDEPEGLRGLDGTIATLDDPAFAALTILVVRDANPDGSHASRRGNAAGVDLNRNWPARNFSTHRARGAAPLSEPETRAVMEALESFRPHLIVVLHSTSSGPFVNHDGPAAGLAEAFVRGASRHDPRWRVVRDMGYPTPGSLGSWAGVDRGIPTLTIELRRGSTPTENGAAVAAGLREVARAAGALAHPASVR